MLAGGIGGTCGDMFMHSLDTVKTRQQGDPHFPPKYATLTSSYSTIFRQEGFFRGLYGGVTPAFWGSFPGTMTFFLVYEFTKRKIIDAGINPNLAYLTGGKLVLSHCHGLGCHIDVFCQVSWPILRRRLSTSHQKC